MKTLTFNPDEALHLVHDLIRGAESFTAPIPAISQAVQTVPGVGGFGVALLNAISTTTERLTTVADTAVRIATDSSTALETMIDDDEALGRTFDAGMVYA